MKNFDHNKLNIIIDEAVTKKYIHGAVFDVSLGDQSQTWSGASGANSAMDMIMEQGRSMMGGFITIQYPYLWLYQSLLFGETASLNAVDAINQSEGEAVGAFIDAVVRSKARAD